MACRFYLFDDNLRCMSKAELVTTVETEFGITEKQKRFVEEMVYNDGSKTNEECAVSAGYAEGSAYVRASELTDPKRFPKVVRYKQHLEAQLSNKYQVTFGRHVRKLADIRDAALERATTQLRLPLNFSVGVRLACILSVKRFAQDRWILCPLAKSKRESRNLSLIIDL